ncbi:ABC transporter permease [Patescibacteria group bacterium]
MKKYLTVFKTEFLHFLQYRSEFFSVVLSILVQLFIFIFITLAIYENKNEVFGISLSEFATYNLLSSFLYKAVETDVNWVLSDHIRSGNLANFFIKPINYNLHRISAELSWKFHLLVYTTITLGVLVVFYSSHFELFIIAARIPVFLLSTFLAYMLNRSIRLLIGTFSFWSKDTGGFANFVNNISSILGGAWYPLEFFGPFINFFRILPFGYLYYFPIQLLIDPEMDFANIAYIIFIQLIWIALFSVITSIFWKRGVKHFESVGL